jgi:hypothetical protein
MSVAELAKVWPETARGQSLATSATYAKEKAKPTAA